MLFIFYQYNSLYVYQQDVNMDFLLLLPFLKLFNDGKEFINDYIWSSILSFITGCHLRRLSMI